MPIPSPQSGENQDAFVNRCMRDSVMTEDFPDAPQRAAVCHQSWRRRKTLDDLELRANPHHDSGTGRFAEGGGSGSDARRSNIRDVAGRLNRREDLLRGGADANRESIIESGGEEGRILVDGIRSYTEEPGAVFRMKEESIRHIHGTRKASPQVVTMMDAINESDEVDIPLYRGMSFSKAAGDKFMSGVKVGGVMDIPMSSWTSDRGEAVRFMRGRKGVMITMEGSKKALNISPLSKFPEDERLSHGRFRISEITKNTRTKTTYIRISQTAVPKLPE